MIIRRTYLVLALLFALVWTTLCVWTLSGPTGEFFQGDADGYHTGAVSLLANGTYTYHNVPYTEREPGQSLWLAMIYLVGGIGNLGAVFFVQGVLFVAAVLLFIRELQYHLSVRVAVFAGVFLLLFPAVLHTVFSLNREGFTLALFLLFSAAFLRLIRLPSWPVAFGGPGRVGARDRVGVHVPDPGQPSFYAGVLAEFGRVPQ